MKRALIGISFVKVTYEASIASFLSEHLNILFKYYKMHSYLLPKKLLREGREREREREYKIKQPGEKQYLYYFILRKQKLNSLYCQVK